MLGESESGVVGYLSREVVAVGPIVPVGKLASKIQDHNTGS